MRLYTLQFKESKIVLRTERRKGLRLALPTLIRARTEIEAYIELNPGFRESLTPVKVSNAPQIIARMANAAEIAGVGPFAAVAGAISDEIAHTLSKNNIDSVVENGGDICLSASSATIGIYAGNSPLSKRLFIKATRNEYPGICTSSGTVGHSLSFGKADSVTIFADSSCLADAVATAACNRIHSFDDIKPALKYSKRLPGVHGAIAACSDKIGIIGNIPELQMESGYDIV